MIQIQSPRQFAHAGDRLREEHMRVTSHESVFCRVQHLTKNLTYFVSISRRLGHTFGRCTCEAGTPTKGRNRVPMVCKHLAAVVMVLRAVRDMRRRASH